jgi:hypothetical protein
MATPKFASFDAQIVVMSLDSLLGVLAEQLGRRSPARLILEIDIGKRLSVAVAHDETDRLLPDAGCPVFPRKGRNKVPRNLLQFP